MFGHRFFQFAPGVHRVRSKEDCGDAMTGIFERQEKPSFHDLRLFLKSVEEIGVPYLGPPKSPFEQYSEEQKAGMIAELIGKKVMLFTKEPIVASQRPKIEGHVMSGV